VVIYWFTGSPALPGNTDPEALPPIFLRKRGRASRHRFPGRAGEPVKGGEDDLFVSVLGK